MTIVTQPVDAESSSLFKKLWIPAFAGIDTSLWLTKKGENVIPAKAGIQFLFISGFRVKHAMTAFNTYFRLNDDNGGVFFGQQWFKLNYNREKRKTFLVRKVFPASKYTFNYGFIVIATDLLLFPSFHSLIAPSAFTTI